jgi:predicted lipase
MRLSAALAAWCAGAVLAGAYAFDTLATVSALPCEVSLDPQRFCVWWGHSALPTLLGVPAVLAFGCYASLTAGSRRPVTVAAALVVLVCLSLRQAAAQEFYV